jgi:hypothetical protein
VRAYFLNGDDVAVVVREVPATQGVGAAALRELLRGPEGPAEKGLTTAIPAGTEVESLSIADGVAHVALTGRWDVTDAALAQVVYTLTQFPTVREVSFESGSQAGEMQVRLDHLTRADYEEQTPQILVETPAPGSRIESPLRIRGTANTFEAMFMVQLFDANGQKLAEKPVTATSGSGERGTFAEQLDFDVDEDTPVTLVAFEPNASNGENGTPAEMHRVDIPITLVP